MVSRALYLAACLTAVACGSSGINPATGTGGTGQGGGGEAGTTGVGGTGPGGGGEAGTTGAGGSGPGGGAGTGGAAARGGTGGIPTCAFANAGVSLSALGEDGMQPRTTVTAPVTVVSVDDCAIVNCGSTSSGTRIVLAEAAGRRWMLYPHFPGMPADIVSAGEALDLWFDYRPFPWVFGTVLYTTTVLARGGTAVLFEASRASDLAAYGITATSSATGRCFDGCFTTSGASVTNETETRDVAPYQTVSLGKLTFTLRYIRDATGGCDPPPHDESMLGFTAR